MSDKSPGLAALLIGHKGMLGGDDEEKTELPADLEDCMGDLLRAIKDDNAEDAAHAFHAAFLACEKKPHKEAGEIEEA